MFVVPSGVSVGKILLLVIIGLVVYAIIKNYKRSLGAPTPPAHRAAEDMVKCAHCGVNLPRSEAILSAGNFFCTSEHQKLGKK
jgi:uncharacterized protein